MGAQLFNRWVLVMLILFVHLAKLNAQDSALVAKIAALEQEYPNASSHRKAVIELSLSEYYWTVQPQKGVEYGRKAIESFGKFKNDSIANSYVNTAICFYYMGEMDSCIFYVEEMLDLKGVHFSNRKLGISQNILCVAYRRNGQYERALEHGQEAIHNFEICGDSLQIAGTLDNISLIYRNWGKYEEALTYSIKSLKIFEQMKDTYNTASTLFNIGDLYMELKNYDETLHYFSKSRILAEKIKDYYFLADIYNSMGVLYKNQEELDSAKLFFNKSLFLYNGLSNSDGVALVQQNIGSVLVVEGNYRQGVSFLRKSEKFYEGVNSIENVTDIFIDLGRAYAFLHQNDSSLYYLKNALKNSMEIHNVNLHIKALSALYDVSLMQKDFKNAAKYQAEYYNLKDSLRSSEVELKMLELNKKYNLEKTQKEALQWKRQQQEEASRSRLFIMLFVGLLLFIILASYFVWQRRKKDREIIALRQERNRILKEEMEQKMRYQSKQLTTHALNMLQKNTLLQSLQEDIDRIGQKAKKEVKPELRSLNHKIKTHLKGEKDWDLFKMYFEQINKDFFKALYDINPDLTSNDLRLLALIKLNMNIKEVASVLNLSPDSVKNARYRLRKKLGLNPKDDLFEFVNGLG